MVKTSLVEVGVVKTRALVGWAGRWEWLTESSWSHTVE